MIYIRFLEKPHALPLGRVEILIPLHLFLEKKNHDDQ